MPPTRSPQTAAGQALKERAEAVRDREVQVLVGKRRLVSIHGQLHVVLKPTREARDQMGRSYAAEPPVKLKFNAYVCDAVTDGRKLTDPEVRELIESHPAFTGAPNQPKVIAWEGDPLVPWNRQMPIQTVQGAIGAGPRPVQPPHPEWDTMEPEGIRELVNAGTVNIQRATVWEAEHRRRPAVIIDLAEAMGRGVAGPDPDEAPEVYAVPAVPESFGPAPIGGV